MKKLIIILLLFLSLQVDAEMAPPPRVCQNNGWVQLHVNTPTTKGTSKLYRRNYPVFFCVLPNSHFYSLWDLEQHKEGKYKPLFDQYSGQYPTFEQIEKAKEKIRKDGYMVE